MKLIFQIAGVLILAVVLFILISNAIIVWTTEDQVKEKTTEINATQFGIILGTSRLRTDGEKNPFFENRMDAGTRLLSSGKVDKLLVSGDNESRYYNEPKDMQNALGDRGVPDTVILKDAAGLRTFDSIVRLKSVYGQDEVVIITQKFHAHRALFIANQNGIVAQAYVAEQPEEPIYVVYIREWIARPLAILDLFVLDSQPKYTE